ncbi:MAG: hypothetical protein J5725_05535 [Bacteroidales bacterium]|nr:hypothetical protein [Bacteroidales bacterium]
MATITSPIILDSTGQDIVTKLNAISTNLNKTASDIPYDANLTIKGKFDAIDNQLKYSTLGEITPTTSETWSSVLGRLRDDVFSQYTSRLNYSVLIANIDGQQGSIFQPFRVYSSATTTHWASIRASGTALVAYVISTTSSNAYMRKFSLTSNGLTIDDFSSNSASSIRLAGLNL